MKRRCAEDIVVPLVGGSRPHRIEESNRYREPMSDDVWHETILNLRKQLGKFEPQTVQLLANEITSSILWLDTVMTKYCEATCPQCTDRCCDGREIFFNQADLLCLIALGREPPPGQTRTEPGAPCRYLGSDGCSLTRLTRPYVCVWFLCEPQMEIYQKESSLFQRKFIAVLEILRHSRLSLEQMYASSLTDTR